jgi:acetate kinase
MCAMHRRKSVATTTGFTTMDGLPMSRRCGNIDPGAVLYLMQQRGMTADRVSDILYYESGLLGVSGVSDDMRTLLASTDPHAADAVTLFVYRISRELGSLAGALGGLDALVFTAGIGEHAAEIRRRVCQQAAWLGICIDETANAAHAPRISLNGSRASAWIITTDEDLMIARHTWQLIECQTGKTFSTLP